MDGTGFRDGQSGDGCDMLVKCLFAFCNYRGDSVKHSPEPHRHSCTEIVYNAKGSGWMHEDERKWRYCPNQIVVYQPGPRHWAIDDPDHTGYHLCIGVSGEEASLIPTDVFEADQNLLLLFKMLENALAAPMPSTEQKSRLDLLASLVCLSLRNLDKAEGADGAPHYAQTAKQLIDTGFMEPLTIDELASRIYVSGDHLRSLFRKEYGIGPIHYLLRKRIEHAQGLLRNSDKKVNEIASICGFDDPYYFSRIFKKISGASPLAYRNADDDGDS